MNKEGKAKARWQELLEELSDGISYLGTVYSQEETTEQDHENCARIQKFINENFPKLLAHAKASEGLAEALKKISEGIVSHPEPGVVAIRPATDDEKQEIAEDALIEYNEELENLTVDHKKAAKYVKDNFGDVIKKLSDE